MASGIKVEKYQPSLEYLKEHEDRLWRLDTKPSAVYVAASLTNQHAALRFALQLQDAGFRVTSRWLRRDFKNSYLNPIEPVTPSKEPNWQGYKKLQNEMGRIDLEDLAMSDTLIILTDVQSSSGGYHVELGYFLGAKKTNVVVVGDRTNVFYWTDTVRFKRSVEGLIEWLQDPSHGVEPTIHGDTYTVVKPPSLDRGEALRDATDAMVLDPPSSEQEEMERDVPF